MFLTPTGLSVILISMLSLIPSARAAQPSPAPDNIVSIKDANTFCMIMPRTPHTNVGDSEHPGGMQTYCTPAARTSPLQGELSTSFWRNVAFTTGKGVNGGRYAQQVNIVRAVTGCIRPETVDRLNPRDSGGQYDSSGGVGGRGNPQGSKCLGYNHYVELVEPAGPRGCIKCCDDPADCPVNKGTCLRHIS
ncbi:hypothetical protein H0H81_001910 [Sphagnurus paluster]|uniref:Secreted protein n=1 Tax=Sphagnurus paluster TaxID=117069 RepID=A0A9P7GM31_9AGAR|nr:hypothetical protein H0H81_001910 [Sphagnurus paluster]